MKVIRDPIELLFLTQTVDPGFQLYSLATFHERLLLTSSHNLFERHSQDGLSSIVKRQSESAVGQRREHLVRVEDAVRVEEPLDPAHQLDHRLALRHA